MLAADRLGGPKQGVDRLLLPPGRLAELGAVGRPGEHLLLRRAELLADLEQPLHLIGLPGRELIDEPGRTARLLEALHPGGRGRIARAKRLRELVAGRGELLEGAVVEPVEVLARDPLRWAFRRRCHSVYAGIYRIAGWRVIPLMADK